MSQRTDRVDELLRQEIGALLAKEIADPRIGFATITKVETSPDLGHAKVWVSVIGGKADRDETVRALQQAMGYIRHELGRRLRIRRIPELHVRVDDSAETATRVMYVLNELEAGIDPLEIAPFDESLPTPVRRLPHEGDTDDPGAAAAPADPPARRTPPRRGPASAKKGGHAPKGRRSAGSTGKPTGKSRHRHG
ncbi:MAG TPA: 30S ribosome-binding factor RbfA [Candidatus Limnocylindrales bacterium]|jgi:ribosome-binding factor A